MITIMEGEDVDLVYRLAINKSKINFLKNGIILQETRISQRSNGRRKMLFIKNALTSDEGKYCVDADGIRSKETQLTIQRMLLSLLILLFIFSVKFIHFLGSTSRFFSLRNKFGTYNFCEKIMLDC